jgi:cyclohexa-1,5-dienecarbonyl-CoA hydratase
VTVREERLLRLDALKLTLDKPKGNVLDASLTKALGAALEKAAGDASLRAVILDAAGNDFCFGASVEEHLPNQVAAMLSGFHRVLKQALALPVPLLVAVQGRCLGGGLELALACSRIFAGPSAMLGQPELKLGVFAPAASALLPERVGPHAAEELLVTGRTVGAEEALKLRLVDELCPGNPAEAAAGWVEKHLLPMSKSSLRLAVKAARFGRAAELSRRLDALERMYLDELMATADAVEGLNAFLQKRPPRWSDGTGRSA